MVAASYKDARSRDRVPAPSRICGAVPRTLGNGDVISDVRSRERNALDARASAVSVSVDCAAWECTVRDDGAGISPRGLEAIRKGRYRTFQAPRWALHSFWKS